MDEGLIIVLIAAIAFIGWVLYTYWGTVLTILALCAAVAVVVPLLIWGIRKYVYLITEPRVTMLVNNGNYTSALDELSRIPDAGFSLVDSTIAQHLDEVLAVLNQRNAELGSEVSRLKQNAERTIRSTGNLEDRLRVARETGHSEEFGKALIEQLAKSYGMRASRE